MRERVTIIMYHYVRPIAESRYPGIKGLELELFKEQLDFLQSRFKFVNCADVRNALHQGQGLSENAVLLTFDDGYADHYQYVFPQLKKRGITGFFSMPGRILAERRLLDVNKIHFLLASTPVDVLVSELRDMLGRSDCCDIAPFDVLYEKLAVANRFDTAETIFVKRLLQVELPESLRNALTDELFAKYFPISEKAFVNELYMTRDQIEVMVANGMEFGIHGYDHKWLGRLPEEEMKNDIAKAVDVFSDVLPKDWCMCFPYGSFSDLAIDQAKSLGAGIGLSTEVRVASVGQDNPMILPRLDTNDFPPKSERYLEIK